MRLKDIYNMINPCVDFKVVDFITNKPLGFCGSLINYNDRDYEKYKECKVVGIKPMIGNYGETYLKILITVD